MLRKCFHLDNKPKVSFKDGAFSGLERLNDLTFKQYSPMLENFTENILQNEVHASNNLKCLHSWAKLDGEQLFHHSHFILPLRTEIVFTEHIFHFTYSMSFATVNSKLMKCFDVLISFKLYAHHYRTFMVTKGFMTSTNVRQAEFLSPNENNIVLDRASSHARHVMMHLKVILCDNTFSDMELKYESNTYTLFKFKGLINQFSGYNITSVQTPNLHWANNQLKELDTCVSFLSFIEIIETLKSLSRLKYLTMRGIKIRSIGVLLFRDTESPGFSLLVETFPVFMNYSRTEETLFEPVEKLVFLHILHGKLFEILQNGKMNVTGNLGNTVPLFHNVSNLKIQSKVTVQYCCRVFNIAGGRNLVNIPVLYGNITYANLEPGSEYRTSIRFQTPPDLDWDIFTNLTLSASLYLRGTQFDCNGTFKLDIERTHMSNVKHIHKNYLECLLQNGTKRKFNNFVLLPGDIISESDKMFLAYVSYTLFLILIYLAAIIYRIWWKVKYAWYTVLQLLYRKEQERIYFQFDAFIAYCNTDEEWVRTRLVPALEQDGGHKYKLCLHYRHFIPGRDIADNIVSAVQSSRKTILIVTKHFLKSGWCDFETKFAHTHHLQKHSGGIIALVHPAVLKMKGNMAASLDRLLDTVTYLEWPKEADEEALLWLSLRRTLGPPLPINVKCYSQYSFAT